MRFMCALRNVLKKGALGTGMLSPIYFKVRQQKLNKAGIWEARGISLCKTA